MSPVFRHGRLRLYLLKLLDDAPKHGYEVIRLLQDRFMGVYAPSPGTIYPRLARLEEEGLVTHDEVDGRKVYRLTEKGREEIRARMDDLAELEREITESVRDIAREVKEDVRQTVRSLREEIAWAARDVHRQQAGPRSPTEPGAGEEAEHVAEQARQAGEEAREQARRIEGHERARQRQTRKEPASGRSGRRDWGDWPGWRDWPGWAAGSGARDWPGWRDRPGQHDWPGRHAPGWPDAASLRDLERMAAGFLTDLGRLASRASAIGEDTLGDLRKILDEALTRIRNEVFQPGPHEDEPPPPGDQAPSDQAQ